MTLFDSVGDLSLDEVDCAFVGTVLLPSIIGDYISGEEVGSEDANDGVGMVVEPVMEIFTSINNKSVSNLYFIITTVIIILGYHRILNLFTH